MKARWAPGKPGEGEGSGGDTGGRCRAWGGAGKTPEGGAEPGKGGEDTGGRCRAWEVRGGHRREVHSLGVGEDGLLTSPYSAAAREF